MVMEATAISFGIVFLAEMGDKSQLISMAFATRYRASIVLISITTASLLLSAVSVTAGAALAFAFPTDPLELIAGLLFLGLALWTFNKTGGHGNDDSRYSWVSCIWAPLAIGGAFFLAEFGDKTMLVTMSLAATKEPIGIWLGSAFGLIVANAVAVTLGAALASRLPGHWIKGLSACAFVLFGLVLIGRGLGLV